jgi:S1-C subfamily serine protease
VAVELRVIATPFAGSDQSHWVELAPGDVLRSGDRFRLAVTTEDGGPLTVTLRSGNGADVVLHKAPDVRSGQSIWLPSQTESYVLDDDAGIETITVATAAGSEIFEIVHAARDFATRGGGRLTDPKSTDTQFPSREEVPIPPPGAEDSTHPRAYAAALASLQPEPDALRTRGAKEAKLYRELADGVVLIVVEGGFGSGSLISDAGWILTNWHVVRGFKQAAVIFKPPPGADVRASDALIATVVRGDRTSDLALLKLTNLPPRRKVLKLGRMEDVEIGMDAHAIGHPTGEFWTYSTGIVSQIRPRYQWKSKSGRHVATVVQIQTPISGGSSGGPLLSDAGRIIGVNSFGLTDGEGLNFAISVKEVARFVNTAPRGTEPRGTAPRAAPASAPAPGQSVLATPPGCEKRMLPAFQTKNGYWVQPYDTNCNGKADIYLAAKQGEDDAARYFIDKDEDDFVEAEFYPNYEGKYDLWVYFDRNDEIEMIGYDYDRDGKIDKYKKIPPKS